MVASDYFRDRIENNISQSVDKSYKMNTDLTKTYTLLLAENEG